MNRCVLDSLLSEQRQVVFGGTASSARLRQHRAGRLGTGACGRYRVLVIISLVFWFWMWGSGRDPLCAHAGDSKIICDRVRPLTAFGHFLEGKTQPLSCPTNGR
jgi:hypothetical protein